MFEFDEELNWIVNRGTGGVLVLTPKEEQLFNPEDIVKLNVYEKEKLEDEPVLTKTAIVAEDGSKATLELTNEDMEIGEIQNRKVDYWYEIKVNGSTVIGWDKETGAKKLRLYPEGSED